MKTTGKSQRLHSSARASVSIGAALLALHCGSAPEEPGDALTIGLLLPFTGTASATASNFERAAIYAASRVNDGGGVKGRRIRIVSRDTHSDLDRSRRSVEELIAAGAKVVIGPESADIATELIPVLIDHGVSFLSPLVGAAIDPGTSCVHPWFRLAPSAKSMGEALAKRLASEFVQDAALLYAADAYNEALRDAVRDRFVSLGGQVALELELDPNAQSYAASVEQAIAQNVDAVVLATSPRTGALVVNEFGALSPSTPHWFLSPLLKTELFVENVVPDAIEGAFGVAPEIYDTSDAFPDAFARRWEGDRPLEGAYFYYDAVGLLAFALEKAAPSPDGSIELGELERAVVAAAAPPGESAGWNEIEVGLQRIRAGDVMYYSGLTGPLLLERCGQRRLGVTSGWEVRAARIANLPE